MTHLAKFESKLRNSLSKRAAKKYGHLDYSKILVKELEEIWKQNDFDQKIIFLQKNLDDKNPNQRQKDAFMFLLKNIVFEDYKEPVIVNDYSIHLQKDILNKLNQINIIDKIDLNSEIEVIYPFLNRNVERIELPIKSLLNSSSRNLKITIVDYGSEENYREKLKDFCNKNNINLIRTEAQGYPWSRSKVLNIGIKNATAKYVATTDMDMIFESDIILKSIETYNQNVKIHARPYWLKEDGVLDNSWLGDQNQLGGYLFIEKETLEKYGYFNESIYYWGVEDIELDRRLKSFGVNTIWLDEAIKMYHMWHSLSYGEFNTRPLSSWLDSNLELIKTLLNTNEINPEIGKNLSIEDRPILKYINNKLSMKVFEIKDYINQFNEIINVLDESKFVNLSFGNRLENINSIVIFEKLGFTKEFFETNGIELKPKFNKNFDYFYLSLPYLKKRGVIDYYIKPDISGFTY